MPRHTAHISLCCELIIWNFHTWIKFFFFSSANDRCFDDLKTFEPRPLVLHCFVLPSRLLREFSSFFSSSRQSMYLIEVIFFLQSMYHNVNKWFLYYCLLQLIWGWIVAIICYNLQVQYMLFLREKKSEQYFIIYFIFIGGKRYEWLKDQE